MNSHWLAKKLANQRACKNVHLSKINYYRSPHFGGYKNGGRLEEWRRLHVGIWLISLSSTCIQLVKAT